MTAAQPIMGDAAAVQEWFGISRTTLYRWARQYEDFPVIRLGGIVRYDFAELKDWLNRRGNNAGNGNP